MSHTADKQVDAAPVCGCNALFANHVLREVRGTDIDTQFEDWGCLNCGSQWTEETFLRDVGPDPRDWFHTANYLASYREAQGALDIEDGQADGYSEAA